MRMSKVIFVQINNPLFLNSLDSNLKKEIYLIRSVLPQNEIFKYIFKLVEIFYEFLISDEKLKREI